MSLRSSPIPPWVIWSLVTVALLVVVWLHAAILAPFVLSLVLAYALRPAVVRLERWKLPRGLAIALMLLLVILVMSIVVVLLVPIVSELAPSLRERLPELLSQGWETLAPYLRSLGLNVPDDAVELRTKLVALLQTHTAELGGALWASLLAGGGSVLTVLGLLALIPMLAFYWLADWERLTGHFHHLLPMRWRDSYDALMNDVDGVMGQYLRGQALVMAILAVYYSVGLALFGFRLALPIGVFTGLAMCIPYIGFGMGLVLALLAGVLQFSGEASWFYPLVAVGVVYGSGQVIESFMLTPRLVGERIGLHPLAVILALMAFGKWLGFWGIVMALPVTALLTLIGTRVLTQYRRSSLYQAP